MANSNSLLLVTVDCLRADHVGFLGYERPTTSVLDSLAKESVVFRSAIVAGTPTYYSFPAILGSRFPLSLGRDVLGIPRQHATLATALRDQGFATAAFVAANPYLTPYFGYEQGFDVFQDFLGVKLEPLSNGSSPAPQRGWAGRLNHALKQVSKSLGPIGAIYDELYFQYCQRWSGPKPGSLTELRRFPAANVIVDAATNWLSGLENQNFFLWIHLMDPHAPYYPTEEALALMGSSAVTPFRARYLNGAWNRDVSAQRLKGYRDAIVELYDAGIRWVDVQIGHLIQTLRKSDLWQHCAFVLTADHGEELLDHGGRFHPPGRLTEELIRVPLLMRVPGFATAPIADSPFSLLHLAPTLLDALNAPIPGSFRGTSHLTQIQRGESWGDPAIVECVEGCTNPFRINNRIGPRVLAVREARFKLVIHFDGHSEELYDLVADPQEQKPLPSTAEKQTRRRLLERARAHLHSSIASRNPEVRLRSQLRDLQLEWARSD
jgi:arylsulfatase A-like enzyme